MPTLVSTGQLTIIDTNDGLNLRLTNQSHVVPTDLNGLSGNFTGCATTAVITLGSLDDSANWAVTATPSAGVTGSLSGKTYTVTAMSNDTGYVDFSASRVGYATLTARFTLAKAKAGAVGANAVVGVLSNESHLIPTDNGGNNGVFTGAATTMSIYNGAKDDSANWTVTASALIGVTGSLSGKTYTVTGMTVDTGYVDLTASRSGYSNVVKRFTLSKSKAGATGATGPAVVVTPSRPASFTSTDGVLDAAQAAIVFTAAVSGVASPTYTWAFSGLQTNPTASTTNTQTITAAQFGTAKSATVTCTVGTYKDTLTIVRLEKSTAAAGATVGATWGTNVGSIPANISTAASSPTVSILNNGITIDAGGTLQGIGSGAGTTVSNALIDIGGTNLLKNSTKASFATSIGGAVTITLESVTLPDGTTGNAIKMVTGAVIDSVRMFNCLRGNDTYSFSTYHRVASGSASTALDVADVAINSIASTTTWQWHKQEGFAVSNYSLGIHNFIDITAPANTTLYFWHPKVEYGNKATDWVPAVEDVDSGIATAATTATWSSVSGTGKPADNATVGAPTGTKVGGVDVAVVVGVVQDFNTSNNRNATPINAPLVYNTGSAVDHVLHSDGSADISLEWVWPYSCIFSGTISGTTLTVSGLHAGTITVGLVLLANSGIAANTYITGFGTGTGGVGTYTVNNSQTVATSTWTWCLPSGSVVGTISGDVLTVTSVNYGALRVGQSLSGTGIRAGTYIKALGTGTGGVGTYTVSANHELGSITINASISEGDIDGFLITTYQSSISTATLNAVDTTLNIFTTSTAHGFVTGQPVLYTVPSGGSPVGGLTSGTTYYAYVVSSTQLQLATTEDNARVGSTIDFTSTWGGTGHTLKGGKTYNIGALTASETQYMVPANKRAFILFSAAADKAYTFGVSAYRAVDKAVNSTGMISSDTVKPLRGSENPYIPTYTVAFTGNVMGTINGASASTVVSNASNGKSAYDAVNSSTSGLATKMGKASSDILNINTSSAVRVAGIKAGDLVWDASGNRTSGKGVAITPSGILGHNGTIPTFAINATTGDATFGGTLNVASATSGERMEITNSVIKVYDATGVLRVKLGNLAL